MELPCRLQRRLRRRDQEARRLHRQPVDAKPQSTRLVWIERAQGCLQTSCADRARHARSRGHAAVVAAARRRRRAGRPTLLKLQLVLVLVPFKLEPIVVIGVALVVFQGKLLHVVIVLQLQAIFVLVIILQCQSVIFVLFLAAIILQRDIIVIVVAFEY